MDNRALRLENRTYAGTYGVSQNNRSAGFKAAFCDQTNGRVELPRFENGSPAPMHIISWLPDEWAASRNGDGTIKRLVPGIVAGFTHNGTFYNREQAATLLAKH